MFNTGLFVLALIGAVTPRVGIATDKHVCSEFCEVRITITLDNVDMGSEVCLGFRYTGDDDPYTRSCWPFNGRRITSTTVKNIPAGDYTIEVRAMDKRAETTLKVVGVGDSTLTSEGKKQP